MEEFFKQSFLDLLYDSLSNEFEENILKDKKESKKYYDISAKENKMYNMIQKIECNDKEKLDKLMEVIKELDYYYCKETEYWNKEYFKLGFTYMLQLKTQVDETKKVTKQEIVSCLVHSFLDALRENKIEDNKKNRFFSFIQNLDIGTKVEKRRFFLYYNLDKDGKEVTFESIAKKERCTNEAAYYTINRFTNLIINLKNDKDIEKLLEIISEE